MGSSRTVALAIVSGGVGGGQRIALAIAEELRRQGSKLIVVSPSDGPSVRRFEDLGAQREIVGLAHFYDLFLAVRLGRKLARAGVAIVYTHASPVHEWLLFLVSKVAGARFVVHRHALGALAPNVFVRMVQSILWRIALANANEVLAVAEHVGDQVETLSGRKPTLVPNGVPRLHGPERRQGRQLLVGCVGRFDTNKRLDDFLEAAWIVHQTRDDIQFVLVVDSELPGTATHRDIRALLDDVLTMKQGDLEAREVIQALDIVVLPSILEGHSITLLEAMSAGKAIVATDIPGHGGTISHGRDGLLVPPRDPPAIANAVLDLAASAALRGRLGASARSRAHGEFSERDMIGQVVRVLQRVD